jgi:hypothetical protein
MKNNKANGIRISLFVILLSFFYHQPFLKLPPVGTHVFRQCHTLAVARNFATESPNIFLPRVDRRYNTEGITGTNFPLYEWGLGMIWKVTGVKENIHRFYSFTWFSIGVTGISLLLVLLGFSQTTTSAGSLFFAFCPEIFYHSINALPDVAALTFSVWALYGFVNFEKEKQIGYLWISYLCLLFAGLIKIYFLLTGVPIAIFLLIKVLKKENNLLSLIPGIAVISIIAAWYKYASWLTDHYGLYEFGLHTRTAESFQEAVQIVSKNLFSDLPDVLLGYPLFFLFIFSIIYHIRNQFFKENKIVDSNIILPVLAWLAAIIPIHVLLLNQMQHHQYYMLPYLIPILLISLSGFEYLFRKIRNIVWIIPAFSVIWAGVRIIPARWVPEKYGIPEVFVDSDSRAALTASLPSDTYTIAGPDPSGCVYFYFLDAKGGTFPNLEELIQDDAAFLKRMVSEGASHLLISDPNIAENEQVSPFLGEKIVEEGEFVVYRINQSPE